MTALQTISIARLEYISELLLASGWTRCEEYPDAWNAPKSFADDLAKMRGGGSWSTQNAIAFQVEYDQHRAAEIAA